VSDAAVAVVNPRDDPSLIDRFDVRSVPLLVVFEDGDPVRRRGERFWGVEALLGLLEGRPRRRVTRGIVRRHRFVPLGRTTDMVEQRTAAPVAKPIALAIAGSDSGGGAGIQADLKTIVAVGAFGTSAVTAVTAQNTRGVESTHVLPVEEIEAQIDAVRADFALRAIKTGMLATAEVVELVADAARTADAPVVVDPVMVAASGDRLLSREAETAYGDLATEAALVTPNADEAEVLTGVAVEDDASARAAGRALVDAGAGAALVKGGHVPGDEVRDHLVTGDGAETFSHPRVATDATHGSGCTLSSAIAARLALGDPLADAVAYGTDLLSRAVRYHHDVGEGPGAVHHLVALRERASRQPTQEAVAGLVGRFEAAGDRLRPLVPEVGTNVVGAGRYAEGVGETAAVEGRITRTIDGIAAGRGVRFGASSHVARLLLAAREHDPRLRFAANWRHGDGVVAALDALAGDGWTVTQVDRREGLAVVDHAFADNNGDTPDAIVDRGAHGYEPLTRLLARDADGLAERTFALADAIERDDA